MLPLPRALALAACLSGCAATSSAPRDASLPDGDVPLGDGGLPGPGSDGGTPRPEDASLPPPVDDAGPHGRVLYLAMPDRFADGDPERNGDGSVEEGGCYDPSSARNFHGGDLAGVSGHLDYLEELGIGALWMTPVSRQVRGCGYHGYWPDLTRDGAVRIDPRFGSEDDLRALRDALHDRGVWLVLDLVLNHAGYNATLTREEPGWFHDGADCQGASEPEWMCALSGLPDFAQEDPVVRDYLVRHALDWLALSGADGIRFDAIKHMPTSFMADAVVPALRAESPDIFLIGEALTSDLSVLDRYLATGISSVFNFPLRDRIVSGIAQGGGLAELANLVTAQDAQLGAERARTLVTLVDNHDLPRFAQLCRDARDVQAAGERFRLGLLALFTLPGIPQLTWGTEIGMLGTGDPDNRRSLPSWAFDANERAGQGEQDGYLGRPGDQFAFVKALAGLRRRSIALARGELRTLVSPRADQDGWVFVRVAPGETLLIALNNGDGPLTLVASGGAMEGDVLVSVLEGAAPAQVERTDQGFAITLPARSGGVYASRRADP